MSYAKSNRLSNHILILVPFTQNTGTRQRTNNYQYQYRYGVKNSQQFANLGELRYMSFLLLGEELQTVLVQVQRGRGGNGHLLQHPNELESLIGSVADSDPY